MGRVDEALRRAAERQPDVASNAVPGAVADVAFPDEYAIGPELKTVVAPPAPAVIPEADAAPTVTPAC